MILRSFIQFAVLLAAANAAGVLSAESATKLWRTIPPQLWAQVVAVPSGTTGAARTDVQPGTPETPPANNSPVEPAPAAPTAAPPPAVAPSTAATAEAGQAPVPVPPVATPPTSGVTTPSTGLTPVRVPTTQDSAPAARLPQDCAVSLEIREVSVSNSGGQIVFAPKFVPAQCTTEPASTVAWIQRAQPVSSGSGYNFTVELNPTRLARQGAIQVGPVSMTVNQAAGRFATFAAAPSRVEFALGAKRPAKQTLTAWSDEAGVTLAATTVTPWLKVTPVSKNGKAGAQKFTVEVAPADLKPGVHHGSIEITSPGAVNLPVQIPVLLTVADKSK